jgi:DNA-binding response OmpR family regulator
MLEYEFSRSSTGAVLVSIAAEALRLQVVDFLNRCGLHVLEAGTASQLLEITKHDCAIALLLADMPVEEAPGLLRATARWDLRALVISGDPDFINRELVPDPGVHFIEKPFSWCELGDKIARLLRPAAASETRRAEPQTARAAA